MRDQVRVPLFVPLWLCWLVVLLVLGGCSGFHVRGADSPTVAPLRGQLVYLQGVDTSEGFGEVLERTLREQGATPVDAVADATLYLELGRVQEDKTVSAYSSARLVREFNHFIEVSYLARRGGEAGSVPTESAEPAKPAVQMPRASVRAERVQIYDSTYVLGAAEEERIIQQELREEAARLLTVRLGALGALKRGQ